tara:strand:- start:666 stop:845 length:180 start_codon:yes stop_codon:yes gene_type:complete
MKDIILSNMEDLITNFLYYDRKEDDELEVGAIEESIKTGDISVDEIVAKFKEQLLLQLP